MNVSVVNPEDKEELALTLEGKKNKFSHEHFERFGKGLGLTPKQITGVFKRFEKNRPKAIEWLDNSFLSDEMKVAYKQVLVERYERILR